MSEIRVNDVKNKAGTGAPSFTYGFEVPVGYGITGAGGINVSGAATVAAGTFSGAVNIDATTDSTSSTSGALIVDGGLGVAKNVYIGAGLSVAGTLTYEDVTNVDSVGLITAKSGLRVNAGGVIVTAGVATFSDKVTVTSTLTGTEGLHVTAGLSTFAGRVNVNSTLEATEGLNVTAGLSTFSNQLNVGSNIKLGTAGVITATTYEGSGANLTGISAGVSTEDNTVSSGFVYIDLGKDDHKFNASGFTTVTCLGGSSGTEGASGTLRITNSGVTTVGFSTYFLWPSGSAPNIPIADGTISLISYTINRNGAVGIATQLLAGASLNFS